MKNQYIYLEVRKPATLLEFLMTELHGISRNKAKDILSGGGVRVDEQVVTRHDHQLVAGNYVSVSKHRRNTELDSPWLRIVYEDRDIIVIDKSPGILSAGTSARQFCVKTILNGYFERRHLKCHAHTVHRLDRDTSGLMVYAKSIEAARILEENWKQRVFDRRYVAIVEGDMEAEGGTCESFLKDDRRGVTRISTEVDGGRFAVTHWRAAKRRGDYTLVELRLETGRKNQIRVHMQNLGHPVCGDAKYGSTHNPLHRLCLHAFRLFLYHPLTGQRMEFETPYPTEFQNFMACQTNSNLTNKNT